MAHAPAIFTISQINAYVKSLLDGDSHLQELFLRGEISNFTNHYRSGHLYFSLKDEKSILKSVMFASAAKRLRFLPQDGLQVIARGRLSLYEQGGQYQFYVEDMQPDGLGALNLAYEQLKNRLAKEGLFDEQRKRPLPRYPRRIGIITSPTGAAVRDLLQILNRRWPLAQIVFCPVMVQGETAAPQLADTLRRLNQTGAADVIIIGRGGGSIEDLWAFNEEIVARAVADSEIPVISAVGHETDFTICDFAADLRAPTPSAAAELAVPNQEDEIGRLETMRIFFQNAMLRKVQESQLSLQKATASRLFKDPLELVQMRRLLLDHLTDRFLHASKNTLQTTHTRLAGVTGKLDSLSPLQVLARGYAIVLREGETLRSAAGATVGDMLDIQMQNGTVHCTVNSVETEEH